jgi:cell division protein FtsX
MTARDALEELKKKNPDLTRLVESEKENPLPDSIIIKDINLNQYVDLNSIISKYKDIIVYDETATKKTIVDYKAQYDRID